MKRITKDDIKKVKKLIEKINFIPTDANKAYLFFPLDVTKVVDNGGFHMEVKDTNNGAAKFSVPGLILKSVTDEKQRVSSVVFLAYGNIDYAPLMDVASFIELTGSKISGKDVELLSNYDCFLLSKEYILSELEF